jgi:hypothetical protein
VGNLLGWCMPVGMGLGKMGTEKRKINPRRAASN